MRIDEIPKMGPGERWLYLYGGSWQWDIGPFRLRKCLSYEEDQEYGLELAHRDDPGLNKPPESRLDGLDREPYPRQSLRLRLDEFADTFNTLQAEGEQDHRYRVYACAKKEQTKEQSEIIRNTWGQMIGASIACFFIIGGGVYGIKRDSMLIAIITAAVICGLVWTLMKKNLELLARSHFEDLRACVEERRRLADLERTSPTR